MSTFSVKQKGMDAAVYVKALARAEGDKRVAADILQDELGYDAAVTRYAQKAAVLPAGANLVQYDNPFADLIEYTTPQTVLGKVQWRRVPLQTQVPSRTADAGAGWVGEGVGLAVSNLQFETLTLAPKKCGSIVILSDELVRSSAPEALPLLRTDIGQAVVRLDDTAFVSNAAATATQPAGIGFGATTISYSTSWSHTFARAIDAFGGSLSKAVWIMSPATAASLNSADRPDVGPKGGSLAGIQVVTSEFFTDDSAGARALLVDPSRVAVCDGGLEVTISRQGTVQMVDAASVTQNATTATGSTAVSLFQANAVGVKCLRYLNWSVASGAVLQVTGIVW